MQVSAMLVPSLLISEPRRVLLRRDGLYLTGVLMIGVSSLLDNSLVSCRRAHHKGIVA